MASKTSKQSAPKRRKMMTSDSENHLQEPNVKDGIDYWETQPASLDGVLGGFGSCSLPRVDALSSCLFLLSLFPELSTVPSALRPLDAAPLTRRTRALDVGAGIGRVTATVLLHIFDDVVLLEPASHFVKEALARVQQAGGKKRERYAGDWKGVGPVGPESEEGSTSRDGPTKNVSVVQGTLQAFDPRVAPGKDGNGALLGRVGYVPSPSPEGSNADTSDSESGYDVVWCQWCLGHLSDADLVTFLRRARAALCLKSAGTGELEGVVVVKENTCREAKLGVPTTVFDEDDSTLTRSDSAWKKAFADAGLKLVKEELQQGFPEGLYPVKTYALR